MCDIFNEEDYLKILQNRFETESIEFLKAERVAFSDDLEGFAGEHFLLNLTYRRNNNIDKETFFIKTAPKKTDFQQKLSEEFNSFQKEIFVYNTLFEEFKKYGFNLDYFPKCYYCKNEETIVMENMKNKQFTMFKRCTFFDMNHCRITLKALAYYHANSIALEETRSEQLGRPFRLNELNPEAFSECFYNQNDKESYSSKFMEQTKVCYKNVCAELIPESKEWIRNFWNKLNNFDITKVFNQKLKSRTTCGHGDLWSNNFLFKYDNGVPIQCCVLDFQLIRHHHPVFDAMLILYSNTGREFRKKHFRGLLKYYYECLCEILEGYGFDGRGIVDEGDFMEAGRALESVAFFQALCVRSFVWLPKDITNNINEADAKVSFQDIVEKDRSGLVIDYCKKNEEMRKIFIDDIYDFNDILDNL